MSLAEPKPQIAVVLLAAGGSTRMGRPKQLLPYRGRTLLRHAAEIALASACRPAVVVLGGEADLSRRELDGLSVVVAQNPAWESGMGSSVRTGVAAALAHAGHLEAVVLMLCDQPRVSCALLNDLKEEYWRSAQPIIASSYSGTLGVPALFSCDLFPELLALDGAAGAKQIISRHADEVCAVPFPEGSVDVDTPQDYRRLCSTRN